MIVLLRSLIVTAPQARHRVPDQRSSSVDRESEISMSSRDRALFPDRSVEEGVRMLLTGGMSLPDHVRGRAEDERV